MKWAIPAKTFLLGEYAAIMGFPAFVLTTSPCFELSLSDDPGLHGIHPESPAGRWWLQQGFSDVGLQWHDPYQGRGGMGASSAQFFGVYLAQHYLQKKTICKTDMLDAYFQSAWQGVGMRPSGYDVLAQSLHGCVYIDGQQVKSQIYSWPFTTLAFILLHTGQKLATHHHLQALTLPGQVEQLAKIVESAKRAFELADSCHMINAVNAYHRQLLHMNLVAERSFSQIQLLQQHDDVLAVKGCGAMGADVLLLLTPKNRLESLTEHLSTMGWAILATSEALYEPCADE